jgi:Protein of unknown function (DUF2487)
MVGGRKVKWTLSDFTTYHQSKEYVDTAVIPLIPISLDTDFKTMVSKGEFITHVTNELERQLKGRVFLFPSMSYLKNSINVIENLIEWKTNIQQEFKHVIFLTSDESLRENNSTELKGNLVWLPTVPLEHMDDNLKKKLLQDQVEQILNILLQSWNK